MKSEKPYDIYLINPPLDKKTTSKFPMSGVPLGIASLAAYLREKKINVNVIDAPISIHHGTADSVVPIAWSQFLCVYLSERNAVVDCTNYPDQPHTFRNSGDVRFIDNMIQFFSSTLK